MLSSSAVRVSDLDHETGNLPGYLEAFERHLRLRNRAPRTIETYSEAVAAFIEFLDKKGMPLEGARLRREHVEAYIEDRQARCAPATVASRYRSLQQFFNYLVDEGECASHPMAKMHVPVVPKRLVPVIPDGDVKALFADCAADIAEGSGYDKLCGLRDTAIMRLFLDTGVRLSEMGAFTVGDITLKHNTAHVYLGKGRKPRVVVFGDHAAQALERYLRARKKHPLATKETLPDMDGEPRGYALWLGKKGTLTDSGIVQMIKRRSRSAGISPHIHPHQFRHTAAHNVAAAGMSETDMMRLFGWDSSEMPKLYGASAGSERAQEAYRRLGIGDKY